MSAENVEVVRQVFDADARRDSRDVFALYDPEVEIDFSCSPVRDFMGTAVYRGHDGVERAAHEWYEAWGAIEYIVEELIDAGDHVIGVVPVRGRGQVSGAPVEFTRHAGVWTIRDGRIVRVMFFSSRAEALEAAGLEQ
jgi:ketosteroid isomerase-like protein